MFLYYQQSLRKQQCWCFIKDVSVLRCRDVRLLKLLLNLDFHTYFQYKLCQADLAFLILQKKVATVPPYQKGLRLNFVHFMIHGLYPHGLWILAMAIKQKRAHLTPFSRLQSENLHRNIHGHLSFSFPLKNKDFQWYASTKYNIPMWN